MCVCQKFNGFRAVLNCNNTRIFKITMWWTLDHESYSCTIYLDSNLASNHQIWWALNIYEQFSMLALPFSLRYNPHCNSSVWINMNKQFRQSWQVWTKIIAKQMTVIYEILDSLLCFDAAHWKTCFRIGMLVGERVCLFSHAAPWFIVIDHLVTTQNY